MRSVRALVAGALVAMVLSTAASAGTSVAPPRAEGDPTAALGAVARAWATAYLTGTAVEIRALQGPECRTGSTQPLHTATVRKALRQMRQTMEDGLGVDPADVRIVGVETRNVTSRSGEAQVQYDLPEAKVGNDNWVTYAVDRGRWRTAECQVPIGGFTPSGTPIPLPAGQPATPATGPVPTQPAGRP